MSHPPGSPRRTVAVAVLAALVIGEATFVLTQTSEEPLVLLLCVCLAISVVALVVTLRRPAARSPRRSTALVMVVTTGVGLWVGSNSPTEQWFGAITSHGDRHVATVALTFDDGPNVSTTLRVRDILDSHGLKGAFFTVGKALDARPDISRALVQDGQLLGNHSYLHDSLHWLDPRYGELARTQRTFKRRLQLCPAFFRPPHGQHTPLMARAVAAHHMTMVGWDVSAGDWATTDAQLVARRVLRRVRSGSIIDLHDGLDGRVEANRSVLVRALPTILDGLAQRGLRVVRLDALIGRAGYLPAC